MAIQIRRGNDAEWESNKSNIVAGEPAVTLDSERMFVGTGSGTYMELANLDVLADAFDSSASYEVGDFVAYHGKVYKCNTAHSGAWNASDFDEVALADALDSLGEDVYTKAEADALLALKADASDVNSALALKADKSDTYTKTEVNTALALKADKSDTYTKAQVDTALGLKSDKADTYTKAQVDSIVEDAIAEAVKESEYSNFEMKTVSGDFIHITDGAGLIPVKDLKIGIDAVQSGSGDPSPENIRPISGWTGAEVIVNGVNQWDEEWRNGYYNSNGQFVSHASTICSKNAIKVEPNSSLYVYSGTLHVSILCYDKHGNYLQDLYHKENSVITVPSNCYYIQWSTDYGSASTYNHDISINYPSTDHDYHAYDGHVYEVTWEEAGTVYGGTLDVTTGVLVVTCQSVDLSTLTWYQSSAHTEDDSICYYGTISGMETDTTTSGMISDRFREARTIYINNMTNGTMIRSGGRIYLATVEQSIEGQLVYPLATPQTYQLTPTEVLTLLGENNIFADTGAVEELIYRISRQ